MQVGGAGVNHFDPANNGAGFGVPALGYLNIAGPTVTIQNPAIEFGYLDGDGATNGNTISANFTGSQLTFADLSFGGALPLTYTFTDAAFAGLLLSPVSSNFGSGILSAALSGNTITINTANFIGSSGNFEAVFSLTAPSTVVPEPGSGPLALCAAALAGVFVSGSKLAGRKFGYSVIVPARSEPVS